MCVYTLVIVGGSVGSQKFCTHHTGSQFAGHVEDTIGLDPDSHIPTVLQSRGSANDGAMVGLLPWVSVLSIGT